MLNLGALAEELRDSNRQLQDILIGIGDLLVALQQESNFPEANSQWKDIKRSIRENRDANDDN